MNVKKHVTKGLIVATMLMSLSAGSAFAVDTPPANPFGLVYGGAITQNVAGHVQIYPVQYNLNGINIAANVYTPADYDASKIYAAIVVAHPNGGTKEQVAGLYAQRLAELGYVTIAADAAFQGASGGEPRHTDKPQFRTEDIHGMADFISTYPGVDSNRLGVLGICGGGGYTLNAAKSDKRFKAVATLSMFNTGEVRRNGYMNTQKDSIQERLHAALDAREKATLTGVVETSGKLDFDAITDESLAKIPTDLYREGMQYYGQTTYNQQFLDDIKEIFIMKTIKTNMVAFALAVLTIFGISLFANAAAPVFSENGEPV